MKKLTWALPTTQFLFVLVIVILIVLALKTLRFSRSLDHGTSIGCTNCPRLSCLL